MKKTILAAAVASLGFATAAPAVTINFDGFSHGDVLSSIDLGGGVSASISAFGFSDNSPNEAWIFDTTLSGTADPDLEGPFTTDGVNYNVETGRALIIQEHDGVPDDDGNGGVITFSFSQAVSFLGFDFLDDEYVTATDNNGNSVQVGQPQGSAFDNYITNSGVLGWTDVLELTFDFGFNSGAIDNLEFDFDIAQVPVPASLPLLLAGLGALGFVSRRKSKAAVAA